MTITFFNLLSFLSCSKDDNSDRNEAPNPFNLITVVNNATLVEVLPTFSWEAAIDPDGDDVSYTLYLDTEENPITIYAENLNATRFESIERLNTYQTYYWRVEAKDITGVATSSNIYSFSTRGLNFGGNVVIGNAAFSARVNHTSVIFNNKLWVIGGYDGSNKNDVWYSEDGSTWKEAINNASFSARSFHTSVVFNDKLWVIGGFNNDIWYSEDGSTWVEAIDNAPFSERVFHSSVVFDEKLWVIGGSDRDIWCSLDGISWNRTFDGLNREGHTSIVFDNRLWLIGGFENSYENDIWYSEDGSTWVEATGNAVFPVRANHTSMVFDDKIWIVGGGNGIVNYNDVWAFE